MGRNQIASCYEARVYDERNQIQEIGFVLPDKAAAQTHFSILCLQNFQVPEGRG